MKHKLIAVLAFTTLLVALGHSQIVRPETPNQIETEHYTIKIVDDYPSQGSIESLVTVQDKRQIVLRNDFGADLRKRCNILHSASIVNHRSPCGALN